MYKRLGPICNVYTYSQQASQKMDSLQQQLEFVSQQRDQAYLQISTLQEQNQTFSVSLANLQMVLEQFQRGMWLILLSSQYPRNLLKVYNDHSSYEMKLNFNLLS